VICPNCHAEYQDSVAVCEACNEKLVASLPEETGLAFDELEAAIAAKTATLSAPRTLDDAKADQELLHEAGVPCLLYGNPESIGPSGAPRLYHLALLPQHLEAATAALGRRRRQMLENEGMSMSDAVVDLTQAELTCPACGTKFPKADTCPECGLFLGIEAPAAEG
jgi:hypothetical protein